MENQPLEKIRIALAGIYGYGTHHLEELAPMIAQGQCELVGVVDRTPPDAKVSKLLAGTPFFTDFDSMLETVHPQLVILATPIPTHAPLAIAAMQAGAHVLVEKPPTATFASYLEIVEASNATGRACQVGFQSFGSHVFDRIDQILESGEIGDLLGIGAVGTWVRYPDYFTRADWAGKRTLNGTDVVDGVVTNPLAHAVATALRIDGSTRSEQVLTHLVDLFHANDIAADDTSAVHILTAKGTQIGLGLTLCARKESEPRIIIDGSQGSMTLFYTQDKLEVSTKESERTEHFERTSLTQNLIAHIQNPGTPLLSSIHDSGGFMKVMEAVRVAPDPAQIRSEFLTWQEAERGEHLVVTDIEDWCDRVAKTRQTFSALGAPWTL